MTIRVLGIILVVIGLFIGMKLPLMVTLVYMAFLGIGLMKLYDTKLAFWILIALFVTAATEVLMKDHIKYFKDTTVSETTPAH